MHADDPMRRYWRLGDDDVQHRAHARRPSGQQQRIAIIVPHDFAQIGQDASQHVFYRDIDAAHVGDDFNVGYTKCRATGLFRGEFEMPRQPLDWH